MSTFLLMAAASPSPNSPAIVSPSTSPPPQPPSPPPSTPNSPAPAVSPPPHPPPPPPPQSFSPSNSPSARGNADSPSTSSIASTSTSSPPPQTPPAAVPATPPSPAPPVRSILAPPPATNDGPPPPHHAPSPSTPVSQPPPPPPPVSSSPPPSTPTKETPQSTASLSPPPSSPPPFASSPPPSSSTSPLSNSPPPPPPPAAPSSTTPPATPPSTSRNPSPSPAPPASPSLPPPQSSKSPPPPAATSPRGPSTPTSTTPPPSGSHSSSSPSTTPLPAPVSHVSPSSSPSHPSSASHNSTQTSSNTTGKNSSTVASQSAGSSSKSGINTGVIVAIGIVVGFIVISLIVIAVWCRCKRRRRISRFDDDLDIDSLPKSDSNLMTKTEPGDPIVGSGSGNGNFSPSDHGGLGNSLSWFTYQELFEATNGFSAENLLGEGGFGSVYKGLLADGREVAVKLLKIGGGQGEREFKAEVEIISRIHHRHLVSLVGYCIFESRRLLVYDYVPNNTLYHHLHRKGVQVLDWARRFKIAAEAARGVAYLHEDCHPRIIHRDIKSSNILLDHNFEARVSDFGLAKLALDADTHVSTRVMGTFGYMAPEYATSGKLTEKSDVYSFGVVLLELITGRKPVDASHPDEGLVEWARPWVIHALETGEFEGLVDPRLEGNYVESEVFRMIEAAAACLLHSSAKRPRMGQIVRAFDDIATSDLNNGMRVGESQMYDSAQQSAEIRWFRRMAFGSHDFSTDFFSGPLQGSQSTDSSTLRRKTSISKQQNQEDAAGALVRESQSMYYSSQSDPGISGHESQSVYYSSQSKARSRSLGAE